MEWTGFTDEELRQLKQPTDNITEQGFLNSSQPRKHTRHGRGGRPRHMQTNRTSAQRGRGPRPLTSSSQQAEPLSSSQMLSQPKEVPNRPRSQQRPRQSSTGSANHSQHTERHTQGAPTRDERCGPMQANDHSARRKTGSLGGKRLEDGNVKSDGNTNVEQSQDNEVENKEVIMEELDENEGISREFTKLEKFQAEQKKMEKDNVKRKALLSRAIADRKKKTQAESKRLAYIQNELSKIEDLLTNDVRILRDRIEDTSRSYLDAQKRYQKAEAEFIVAKCNLHKIEDMKESLTEHLCTIIHENELRKHKKLEELVNKLEIDNLEEFEKQIDEENVAKIPTTTQSDNVPNSKTSNETTEPSTSNQSETPIVIATDQAIKEKQSSVETTGNIAVPSIDVLHSSNTEDNKISLTTDVATSINGNVTVPAVDVLHSSNIEDNKISLTTDVDTSINGANQESAHSTSTSSSESKTESGLSKISEENPTELPSVS